MPKGDPSYKNYRHKSSGAPRVAPTGKKNDRMPTSGAKQSAGIPDGRVSDMGRQKSPGRDGKGY